MALTGAWAKRSTPSNAAPLKPGPDPEHEKASPLLDVPVGQPGWAQSGPTPPTLPAALDSTIRQPDPGGIGPVDESPDFGHGLGIGPGHAMTIPQVQEERRIVHGEDLGAPAANTWVPMINRDGYNHVDVIADTDNDGESPQTVALQRSGLGVATDPYARTGRRIKRWYDRFIDMHDWAVERRPAYIRNAYTGPNQPPVPGGNQLDSPFQTFGNPYVTPDSFVAPQTRRAPGAWDEYMQHDGTYEPTTGLGSWGL